MSARAFLLHAINSALDFWDEIEDLGGLNRPFAFTDPMIELDLLLPEQGLQGFMGLVRAGEFKAARRSNSLPAISTS